MDFTPPQTSPPTWFRWFLAALALWGLALAAYVWHHRRPGPLAVGAYTPVPQSEREFKRVIIGLNSDDGRYFDLPVLEGASEALRRELYWLDFETSHGRVLDALPEDADLYVGVPPSAGGQAGRWFRDYLRQRLGWSRWRILRHVHEVPVLEPLLWTQDCALALGYDAEGRLVLASSPDDGPQYRQFVAGLVHAYPEDFRVLTLPRGLSAEGGDMAVVRGPAGLLLVLGRHRILRCLELLGWGDFRGKPVPAELLAQVERAYAAAIGLPVLSVPRRALLEGWGEEELFHLDMAATFLSGPVTLALVARVTEQAFDAAAGRPLEAAFRRRLNRELDAIAAELAQAGFTVKRMPLVDHPVRSPANLVRGRLHGQADVLLSLYPSREASSPGRISDLQAFMEARRDAAQRADLDPSGEAGAGLRDALDRLWAVLDREPKRPTPEIRALADELSAAGFAVYLVPDYPWGAGGLHCQLLH